MGCWGHDVVDGHLFWWGFLKNRGGGPGGDSDSCHGALANFVGSALGLASIWPGYSTLRQSPFIFLFLGGFTRLGDAALGICTGYCVAKRCGPWVLNQKNQIAGFMNGLLRFLSNVGEATRQRR